MFDRMLVPTDGSDLSTQAALRAVALAKTCGAHVTVLLVQDVYPYTGIGSVNADDLQAYVAKARAEGLSAMDPVAQAAREEGVPVETLVVENDTLKVERGSGKFIARGIPAPLTASAVREGPNNRVAMKPSRNVQAMTTPRNAADIAATTSPCAPQAANTTAAHAKRPIAQRETSVRRSRGARG